MDEISRCHMPYLVRNQQELDAALRWVTLANLERALALPNGSAVIWELLGTRNPVTVEPTGLAPRHAAPFDLTVDEPSSSATAGSSER